MKLISIGARPRTRRVIQQFGEASLIRLNNGQHELVGGSHADRAAAFEWVSLFAHEIVFTHFGCGSKPAGAPIRFPDQPVSCC